MIEIPDELIALAAERRLIPFVGAGFSAALDLPSWETMLRELCAEIDGSLTFEELELATGGDYLQIAEYLFLKCDKRIGPIRSQLERSLSVHKNPLTSGPHVELVNLGAAQIYTTNYDDLIESTYKALDRPISTVVLPKDVALADTERTQIVKYHGDLKHENTLVLTESAYYKRLDFESPMDLKFRSDLLGKSVLFMGYSFRDVNIRIIWFKLMQMMRDIPEADRRPSYIVRLEPNPALDQLNAAVGLKTIVLNPDGPVDDPKKRVALLGEFLLELANKAAELRPQPPAFKRPVVSAALIQSVQKHYREMGEFYPKSMRWRRGFNVFQASSSQLDNFLHGLVPTPLKTLWQRAFRELIPFIGLPQDFSFQDLVDKSGAAPTLTSLVVQLLASQGDSDARKMKSRLLSELNEGSWKTVWASSIKQEDVEMILLLLSSEVNYQATKGADEDIAFLAELAKRIVLGQLGPVEKAEDVERLTALLGQAEEIYPSIGKLKPSSSHPPQVDAVLKEVEERKLNWAPARPSKQFKGGSGAPRNS